MGFDAGVAAAPVWGRSCWLADLGGKPRQSLAWIPYLLHAEHGAGVALFVLAMFLGSLEKLPGSGEWMLWVRKLMGWVLVGMAAYFLRPLLPSWLAVVSLAGVCIAAGLHLGWLDSTRTESRVFGWLRLGAGFAGLVAGFYLINASIVGGPGVSWKPYSPAIMEEAKRLGKPVIVDFSAAWCTPCQEMEHITFRDPEIVKQADRFEMLKVDLTKSGDPLAEQLVRQYFISGVPTIIFSMVSVKRCAGIAHRVICPRLINFSAEWPALRKRGNLVHNTRRWNHVESELFLERAEW